MTELLTIILAAGEGTRMRSGLPKVMHAVGGLPLVGHAVQTAKAAGASAIAVVVGPNHEAVRQSIARMAPEAGLYEQTYRLGTAHAVREARAAFAQAGGNVIVLYGDNPLVRAQTIRDVAGRLESGAGVVVVGFEARDASGYGRLLTEDGRLLAIREDRDATDQERAITLCNSGIMGFRAELLRGVIDRIGNSNAKGEFYLTDAVELARADGARVEVAMASESEALGVNDRAQLAKAEAQFQELRRNDMMAAGVTLRDPATVFFSWDTAIERDVVIEPNVVFGPGVAIGEGAVIRAFSHIEGATIGANAEIGPFARLRPEARLAEGVKVGNFVEVKKSNIGKGAKLNHLSYVGDTDVGAKSNIGAGTITCNYDGTNKHRTVIGEGVFVGSNSALVAPVTIGDGAYIGTGSVITEDVEPDALAIARSRQVNKPGRATQIRARGEALKAKRGEKR